MTLHNSDLDPSHRQAGDSHAASMRVRKVRTVVCIRLFLCIVQFKVRFYLLAVATVASAWIDVWTDGKAASFF